MSRKLYGEFSIGLGMFCLLVPIIGVFVGLAKLKEGTGKIYLGLSVGMMIFVLVCAIIFI